MNRTEQNKAAMIRELAKASGPCITLVLAGNEQGDTSIELKDALASLRKSLNGSRSDPDALLAPIANAVTGRPGEAKAMGSVVVLRSPEVMQVFRAPGAKHIVQVADRFDLRTLISVLQAEREFYILALSQNRTRILKCTGQAVEEIPFPEGFPTSLAEAMQTRKPDHTLENRASGGPSMGQGAVMFGTSSDRDEKPEYLANFFAEVNRAVHVVLKGKDAPLIPVAVDQELALYQKINTYEGMVMPGVHGAPDGYDSNELVRRATEQLAERERAFGNAVPEDFDKRVGTGHASTHVQDIVQAAYEGRVSHLFFQMDAHYLGKYDAVRQKVKHTEDPVDSPEDLVDAAARETITHGGDVKILPGSAMPNGVRVCALFRYPDPAAIRQAS